MKLSFLFDFCLNIIFRRFKIYGLYLNLSIQQDKIIIIVADKRIIKFKASNLHHKFVSVDPARKKYRCIWLSLGMNNITVFKINHFTGNSISYHWQYLWFVYFWYILKHMYMTPYGVYIYIYIIYIIIYHYIYI